MGGTIYYHEDDYGQMELLPQEAWTYCQEKMQALDDFAASPAVHGGYSGGQEGDLM